MHFIANKPSVSRTLMVKAIEVTQMRYKPYATIESTEFSNTLVFFTIWYKLKITWMGISIWRTKAMLNVSFEFMYLLMRMLMLLPAQHLLPLYWPVGKQIENLNAYQTLFGVMPTQYKFKKYKNCVVLIQLHLMLKIFAGDAWLALWTFFEKFCRTIFWTTLQDLSSLLNNVSLINRLLKNNFYWYLEICCNSGMLVNSYRYCGNLFYSAIRYLRMWFIFELWCPSRIVNARLYVTMTSLQIERLINKNYRNLFRNLNVGVNGYKLLILRKIMLSL